MAGISAAGYLVGCGSSEPTGRFLRARVLGELAVFTRWLDHHGVRGFIGEVGWPDDYRGEADRWNQVAEAWYGAADAGRLWVTAWASGEWWPTSYPLRCYYHQGPSGPVNTPNTQARVLERHPSSAGIKRGVNVAGGAFGAPAIDPTSGFSNLRPGQFDRDYHYDTPRSFAYLRSRDIRLVRLEFRWERLQPRLGEALDETELARLRAALAGARASQLEVVLDMHNYGAYYVEQNGHGFRQPLGSAALPVEAFADAWRRISVAFRKDTEIAAYGLMNEPINLNAVAGKAAPQVWENASQSALSAIRASGDSRLVMVGGYEYSAVQTWAKNHPVAWIKDPADRFRYEGHHYWDSDHSSHYVASYAEEAQHAIQAAGG